MALSHCPLTVGMKPLSGLSGLNFHCGVLVVNIFNAGWAISFHNESLGFYLPCVAVSIELALMTIEIVFNLLGESD